MPLLHLRGLSVAEPIRSRAPMVRACMADLTVYEKPTCSTCRNLAALLRERGIDYDAVDYHVTGLTEPELRHPLACLGAGARSALPTREPRSAELAARDNDSLIA